jgi:hypothetical protein
MIKLKLIALNILRIDIYDLNSSFQTLAFDWQLTDHIKAHSHYILYVTSYLDYILYGMV